MARRPLAISTFSLIATLALGSPGGSVAQAGKAPAKPAAKGAKPEKAAPPAPPKVIAPELLEKLRAQLEGSDDDPAADAAKALGDSGATAAAGALIEVLAVGTRPPVASAALDNLGRFKDVRAIDVLTLYAGNRNPELRRRAVKDLGVIPDARVVPTLLERLGDAAPDVRVAAAEALAARNEPKAEARLFQLVRRNDLGVAGALGTLATPDTISRLADLQGRVEDNVISTALGEYLKRNDAKDPVRVEVVKTLAKIPGAAATTALVEYLAMVPEKEERPSKTEAQKVVDQRGANK